MATQEEINELMGKTTAGLSQGPNITLTTPEVKKAKTPLTFEEMLELTRLGKPIPPDRSPPTNLTMEQYGQFPGGLAAYTNITDQMKVIKGSAGFGKGPGGLDIDPSDDLTEEDKTPQAMIHHCPSGYVFDSSVQMCVPQAREDEDPQYDDVDRSYNSFVDMVTSNSDYDGSWESFQNVADNSWMGKTWNNFFNNTDKINHNLAGRTNWEDIQKTVSSPTAKVGSWASSSKVDDVNEQRIADRAAAQQVAQQEHQKELVKTFDKPKPKPKPQPRGDVYAEKEKGGINYSTNLRSLNQGGFVINTDLEGKIVIKDTAGNELTKESKQEQPLPMQEGGPVEGMPMPEQDIPVEGMEGMPAPSGQEAGFVEDPMAAPAPDTPIDALQGEGQQDDVQGELPEGTFVINAMAVQLAGLDELDKMVESAYETMIEMLKEKGVDVPLIQQLVDRSKSIGKVDVAVSNGEYIIPPELVPIIGEDKLRKINDRGLRKLEETKETQRQQDPMAMQEGGFVFSTKDKKIPTETIVDKTGREKERILSKEEVEKRKTKTKTKAKKPVVAKQGKQGTSFISKKEPSSTVETLPSSTVKREKLDLLGSKQTIDQQLSIPQNVRSFMEGQKKEGPEAEVYDVPKEPSYKFSLEQQLRLINSAYEKKNTSLLESITKGDYDWVDEKAKERAKQLLLDLLEGKTNDNSSEADKVVDKVEENKIKFFDKDKNKKMLHSAIYKKYDQSATSSLDTSGSEQPVSDKMQAIIEYMSQFDKSLGEEWADWFKSIMPRIDDKAKERFKNYIANDVRKDFQQSAGLKDAPSSFMEEGEFDETPDNTPEMWTLENIKGKNLFEVLDLYRQTQLAPRKGLMKLWADYIDSQEKNQELNKSTTYLDLDDSALIELFNYENWKNLDETQKKEIQREIMKRNTMKTSQNKWENVSKRRVGLIPTANAAGMIGPNVFQYEGDLPEKIDSNDERMLNVLYDRVLAKENPQMIFSGEGSVSPKGAMGFSQLMPATVKDPGEGIIALLPEDERKHLEVGEKALTDPVANLLFGFYYLKAMLIRYDGNVAEALSAYNDGLGDHDTLVQQYGGKWHKYSPDETKDYIRSIKGYMAKAPEIELPKSKPKRKAGGFV